MRWCGWTTGGSAGKSDKGLVRRSLAKVTGLSNVHLYNLRRSMACRGRRIVVDNTRPTPVAIGERRKPRAQGQPGYVRVDTAHQGDPDGVKGGCSIHLVDDVTQFQFVGCVEVISERFPLPAPEGLIEAFPFAIQGIYADNGSEYTNHRVVALLNKLRIGELTKSRPRHCNDNAPRSSRGQALSLPRRPPPRLFPTDTPNDKRDGSRSATATAT